MSKHSHKPIDNQTAPGGQGSGETQDVPVKTGDGREKPEENGDKNRTEIKPEDPDLTIPASATEAKGRPFAPGTKTAVLEAELADRELKITGLTRDFEARLADLNDQYLRKAADFENFRKRMNREKQEITDFANQTLLLDLLPVIDDFERAIKSAETSRDFASFFKGVSMIEKQLSTQLENKWGLKRFDSEGQLFDPNRHEALQMEKSTEVTEATVKEDYLKGYLLRDRVLRFAKVKVAMPEGGGGAAAPAGEAKTGEE